MPKSVLAVGDLTESVRSWCDAHGCVVVWSSAGVFLVTLPETARISRAEYTECFTVVFSDGRGDYLDEYLYYSGGANVCDSDLEVRKETL